MADMTAQMRPGMPKMDAATMRAQASMMKNMSPVSVMTYHGRLHLLPVMLHQSQLQRRIATAAFHLPPLNYGWVQSDHWTRCWKAHHCRPSSRPFVLLRTGSPLPPPAAAGPNGLDGRDGQEHGSRRDDTRQATVGGRGLRDDTGSSDKRVREGGLAVIDVSDHRHRTDVLDLVLDHLELGDGKVHLRAAGRVSVALNE